MQNVALVGVSEKCKESSKKRTEREVTPRHEGGVFKVLINFQSHYYYQMTEREKERERNREKWIRQNTRRKERFMVIWKITIYNFTDYGRYREFS